MSITPTESPTSDHDLAPMTFSIALSGLLLLAPSGAFLLDQHRPHSPLLVSFSRSADGTPSALSVKEDVSDAETVETTKTDLLDVSSFLNDMEKEIEGISTLKEATGIGTLLPDDEAKGDIYTRAVAKMEAMAQDSINKHKADMEEFNNDIDVATKNELDVKTRKNGPIIAFSFLSLAIGCGMVATAPEAIYGIDLNTVIDGLPTIDLPSLNIDLPIPQIGLSGIGANIDVTGMTTAVSNAKDSILAQAESFSAAFPTIVNEMTNQAQEAAGSISNQVQGSLESVASQAELISGNIAAQANNVRDVALPAAQSAIVAQVDALQANIPSVGEIQDIASAYSRNMQYFVGPVVEGQIESIQISLNDAQLSIASYSDDLLREMATFQNVALDKVNEIQHTSVEQAQALQNTIQAKATSIDVDSIVSQAQLGTDAVMKQTGSSLADANELIQTKIADVDTFFNTITGEAAVAIQTFRVPDVDVTLFVDRAKSIQEAISTQISYIEFPTSVDISSLKEATNKVAEDKIAEIEPILQQNLGIPL